LAVRQGDLTTSSMLRFAQREDFYTPGLADACELKMYRQAPGAFYCKLSPASRRRAIRREGKPDFRRPALSPFVSKRPSPQSRSSLLPSVLGESREPA